MHAIGMVATLGGCFYVLCALGVCCASETFSEPDNFHERRAAMIRQLRDYNIKDEKLLKAMEQIPRHLFIPEAYRQQRDPYGDHPCPIGYDQTISQPYIVAYMTEKIAVQPGMKILEIGTGSGYQAAVLAECGADVYSIEIIPALAEHARAVLQQIGTYNIKLRTGDGYQGWQEQAPFDAIIVTCAPEDVPKRLIKQLRDGGRMIVPVGKYAQRLLILIKKGGQIETHEDLPVRFVPMVHGKHPAHK